MNREDQIKKLAMNIAMMFEDEEVDFDIGVLALAFAYANATDAYQMSQHAAMELVLSNLKLIEKE